MEGVGQNLVASFVSFSDSDYSDYSDSDDDRDLNRIGEGMGAGS
jgi:hypothetical protein